MSEPFIERLSRFTPNAGALDRDALLYAAGRASARTNRAWIVLTAALAVTQPLSLILLWPRSVPPAVNRALPIASRPSAPEHSFPDSADIPGSWSSGHKMSESEREDNPVLAGAATFVDNGPPLRAFAPPPPSILN